MYNFFNKAVKAAVEYLLTPESPESSTNVENSNATPPPPKLKRSPKGVSNLSFMMSRTPKAVRDLANLEKNEVCFDSLPVKKMSLKN